MSPEVLYLILCGDVQTDPTNYHRLMVVGLLTTIRSGTFPVVEPDFSALLVLTGCQGSGELAVQVVQAQTGVAIFRTRRRLSRFVGDPADVVGARFRLRNCTFPVAGLYWVEAVYDGSVIARQQLFLRAWKAVMPSDPATIHISCDELVSFCDDAANPAPAEVEVIVVPTPPQTPAVLPAPSDLPPIPPSTEAKP
jgi:hypothetical protein